MVYEKLDFNKKPDVAIIVPVYNAEKYLRECINSILQQTFTDFSVVLVDDGSKDRSGEICDFYAKKDSRIHVIHQQNKGAVEARKTGVLSGIAQECVYIMLCDADDTLEPNAIDILYKMAQLYKADCVCGATKKLWKNIKFSSGYLAKCFQISQEQVYNNQEILEQLYISCFGISNYPVSLWAKLYKTELLTKAIDFEPIVRFMGEDLSVTMRCLPETERLVIIPDNIYNYRIGGNTSKFMPYMLEDFMSLYKEKRILMQKYSMPQDTQFYIDVELMNVVINWLKMCYKQGKYKKEKFQEECKRVCKLATVRSAAANLYEKNIIATMVYEENSEKLGAYVLSGIRKARKRDLLLEILKRI